MEWEAVTAISEIIGTIVVILSLFYLAIQIRQNTRSIEGSTEQSLMTAEMETYSFIALYAGVYRRGCDDTANLDADEMVVFEQLVLAVLSQLYGAFVQYQRKLIPETVWQAYLGDWQMGLEMPGLQEIWNNYRQTYPVEFSRCLDEYEASLAQTK